MQIMQEQHLVRAIREFEVVTEYRSEHSTVDRAKQLVLRASKISDAERALKYLEEAWDEIIRSTVRPPALENFLRELTELKSEFEEYEKYSKIQGYDHHRENVGQVRASYRKYSTIRLDSSSTVRKYEADKRTDLNEAQNKIRILTAEQDRIAREKITHEKAMDDARAVKEAVKRREAERAVELKIREIEAEQAQKVALYNAQVRQAELEHETKFEVHLAQEKAKERRAESQREHETQRAEAEAESELKRVQSIKEERERERDHELQMALIQREIAVAQAEAARLTAEANAKAQEQASASLDGLINGLKDDG